MPFSPPETVAAAPEDESPQFRFWAAGALGHAGRGIDPSVPALLRHAEHDSDAEVRSVCADELQDYHKPPAVTPAPVPILTQALESPNRRVRAAARAMIGRFGPESTVAIPSILNLVKGSAGRPGNPHEDASRIDHEWQAATALSKLAPGTPYANQAATSLVETFLAQSLQSPTRLIPLIEALARFGPLASGAVPRLRELAQGRDQFVSESAHKSLAIITAPM